MQSSKAIRVIAFIIAFTYQSTIVKAQENNSVLSSDSVTPTQTTKKKTFFQQIMKPFKWIGKNWSAYDPRYSTPSFYNWVGQFQNTSSLEMLHLKSDGQMDLKVQSKWSHKIGPHLGYSFLFYGYTLDINAIKGTKRRQEFTLSVNSNLVNIDLIRRRTGGDFMFDKFILGSDEFSYNMTNLYEQKMKRLDDVGESMYYDLTGFNINYFTNHKKYSNPAAFSNGAIQLRSVGSPILGFGYFLQKLTTTLPNSITELGLWLLRNPNQPIRDEDTGEINDYMPIMGYEEGYDEKWADPAGRYAIIQDVVSNNIDAMKNTEINGFANNMLFNSVPSVIRIHDYHLQLGYAYNLVFSRRLLLGMSLIASPGLKVMTIDNSSSAGQLAAAQIAEHPEKEEYKNFLEDIGVKQQISQKTTSFGVNCFARASLTYNYNRWRAGFNANFNSSFFRHNGLTFDDGYGSLCVYLGYCFGRKKEYRWNGKNREAYIDAALTKYQKEEMRDTFPSSNIDKGKTYEEKWGKTKYKTDVFNFDIRGCDLVKGPDGTYGQFVVKEGRVTHGNDTEEKIHEGTVYQMDKDGHIEIESGRHRGIRPSNWLKSKLTVRQMPTNWYPELLHYSLCGTLSFYVRDVSFGTRKPVKISIDDFYLSHSWDTQKLFFIGAKDYYSHSSFSIIGTANVNGRLCRVYIESKKHGKNNYIYINSIKLSSLAWMKYITDDRAISKVSLPGTHDAGSSSLPESRITSMAHTQNFTIPEQLGDGIRAFDIRLKENMKYGHTIACRDGFDESMDDIAGFLKKYPSEFIVALIGSDEGGKWSPEMQENFKKIIDKYPDLFVEDFDATTKIKDVRGKILVIKRQEDCPFGKLLKFEDNTTFTYDCFNVEDVYRQHKTYKKSKIVEDHIREAYENEDPSKWYITFNSIAWDPRHHKPYYSAWGAVNVRKPMNKFLREMLEKKQYNDFGMIFLDFYNDHGDRPELVQSIIKSNYHLDSDSDYVPAADFKR